MSSSSVKTQSKAFEEKAPDSMTASTKLESGQVSHDAVLPLSNPCRQIQGFKWVLVACSIYSSMFIYSLDTTITADLVPSISNAFDSVPELPWLSVGFTAGAFVGLLPMGRLYAKFNVKYVYIISVVVFLASSALCGAAPNMTAMIFGRVFLGVAGSAMYCGIMTLITIFATDAERPLYFALCGLVWSVGTVLGPVVGGAFAKANWRWAFYFNLIVGGLFLPLCIFLLPSFDPVAGSAEKRRMQRLKTLDFLGTILLIAFPLCLLMGINFGGILYPWNSGSIIALFVVGGVLGLAFVTQQYFSCLTSPAERLFPGLLFWHREPLLLFIISIGTNIASFIAIFYIPLYFQFTKGDTPIEAAVRLLPQIIVFSVFNMIQGAFVVKLGYYWPWFLAGGAAILAGNMMLFFVRPGTENAYIYGSEVVLAIGLGLCNQTPFSVIHSVVHAEDMGLAVPFILFAQFTGVTLGLSVSGAIFVNQTLKGLQILLPDYPEAVLRQIVSGTSSSALEVIPDSLRSAVINEIVSNIRSVFIPAIFGSGLALLVSMFLNKKGKVRAS